MMEIVPVVLWTMVFTQASGTAPAQQTPPQNDQQAVSLMLAMPDAYAKLDSFKMQVVHRATVEKQTAEVISDVLAMKPNLFVIDQAMRGPAGTEKRRFVCNGSVLAMPEPRHLDRFIGDPHPLPQWAGNLRGISTLTLDGAWPLGVAFRTKEETEAFVNGLYNVKYEGKLTLQDGTSVHRISALFPSQDPKHPVKVEVLIGEDGLMRRLALVTSRVTLTQYNTSDPNPKMAAGNRREDVVVTTTLTWDISVVKNPQLSRDLFKLPLLSGAPPK